jgi:hypothetical protein
MPIAGGLQGRLPMEAVADNRRLEGERGLKDNLSNNDKAVLYGFVKTRGALQYAALFL